MIKSNIDTIPFASIECKKSANLNQMQISKGKKIYYCKILNARGEDPVIASYGNGYIYRVQSLNQITLEPLNYPEAELYVPKAMGNDFLAPNRIECCIRIYISIKTDDADGKTKKGIFILATNPFL